MKKWISYSLLLLLGLIIGISIYHFFFTEKEVDQEVSVIPKELRDHLRYLESSLDTIQYLKSNPIPGEWLFHNQETQQYPHEFLSVFPNILEEKRDKIYIQPIGAFSVKQKDIIAITAEYLRVFYSVDVAIMDAVSADEIPAENRRISVDGNEQLQTTYIMDEILTPNIPDDARAYMGFTAYDLYPNDKYNFVFGQGRVGGKVGIYSIARFGFPDQDSTQFDLCLKRTLKVASHELGHIFGITHCVDYECIMNGSNYLDETDAKPVYFCPLDLLKVSQGLGIDEVYRYKNLAQFWEEKGYRKEADFYRISARLLEQNTDRREGGLHNNQ